MQDEYTGGEGFLDEREDLFWVYDEEQCFWTKFPFQGRSLRKGGKFKGQGKSGKSKGGKGSSARRFFRPYRKGGGKGKKSGKGSSSSASKASVAEDEIKEEEAEDDALLTDKKKRKRRPQAKKKSKPQLVVSAAHEADAVDEDGFLLTARSPCRALKAPRKFKAKMTEAPA